MVNILLGQKWKLFNEEHNTDEEDNHGKNRRKWNPKLSQTLTQYEEKDQCHDIEYQVW